VEAGVDPSTRLKALSALPPTTWTALASGRPEDCPKAPQHSKAIAERVNNLRIESPKEKGHPEWAALIEGGLPYFID
jgi:hypothetical protein